ncbi:MAG: 50S ribosomal protein L23 [bacterium]|nr:50S ribosomal protein L23 [bacterium]
MSFFTKKTEEKKGENKAVAVKARRDIPTRVNLESILIRPRITEKGAILADSNAYAFEVQPKATKHDVSRAVSALYKVIPAKVRVVKLPGKKVFVRGKSGRTAAIKKAYVYLKKGDKIEVV